MEQEKEIHDSNKKPKRPYNKVSDYKPNGGNGRPKGTKNRITRTIREAIELSFEAVGGADYLARMAILEPVAYMSLLGKILPTQVKMTADKPLNVTFNVVDVIEMDALPSPKPAEEHDED